MKGSEIAKGDLAAAEQYIRAGQLVDYLGALWDLIVSHEEAIILII